MKIFAILSAVGILSSLVYYLAAIVAGLIFAHRAHSEPKPLPKIPPRVAILKPLRGVTENLRANIISYLEIAYARVEYIFGVTSYEDRAIDIPVNLRGAVSVRQYDGRSWRGAWRFESQNREADANGRASLGQNRHLRAQRCGRFGRAR